MLEREMQRLGVNSPPMPGAVERAEVGERRGAARGPGAGRDERSASGGRHSALAARARRRGPRRRRSARAPAQREPELEVQGIGDLLSTYARCCKPVPPEPIVGYITVGRGVSIHSQSCANLARLSIKSPARVLAVDLGQARGRGFPGGHRGPGLRPPRPGARCQRGARGRENQHSQHEYRHRQARPRRSHADRHRDHAVCRSSRRCWRASRSCPTSSAHGARNEPRAGRLRPLPALLASD